MIIFLATVGHFWLSLAGSFLTKMAQNGTKVARKLVFGSVELMIIFTDWGSVNWMVSIIESFSLPWPRGVFFWERAGGPLGPRCWGGASKDCRKGFQPIFGGFGVGGWVRGVPPPPPKKTLFLCPLLEPSRRGLNHGWSFLIFLLTEPEENIIFLVPKPLKVCLRHFGKCVNWCKWIFCMLCYFVCIFFSHFKLWNLNSFVSEIGDFVIQGEIFATGASRRQGASFEG